MYSTVQYQHNIYCSVSGVAGLKGGATTPNAPLSYATAVVFLFRKASKNTNQIFPHTRQSFASLNFGWVKDYVIY